MVRKANSTGERPLPDGCGSDGPAPVERTEWVLVAVLLLVGTILRCWQPSHMAVEHFDEGVYASNLYSPGGAYPYRHLYAPPLLPALLEWALILSGGTAGAVMAVNVIAGSAMIPSLWWVGRQWFGRLAGLTAAALAAFSSVHILYSRTALTDVLLCLWMLWGVYWAWRAILTGQPAAILLAAVFASLAWWTKYNGWLTLAVSGSGVAAWTITSRFAAHLKCAAKPRKCAAKPPVGSAVFRWSVIASLTLASWLSNVATDLQGHGGYAVVAANHAGYFVGPGGWWSGFLRQWANLNLIETGGGSLALALVGLVLIAIGRRDVTARWLAAAETIVIAAVLMAIMLLPPVTFLVLLAAVGIGRSLTRHLHRIEGDGSALAAWMLAAWFAGLFLAIPLYTPYPRLTLPLLVAVWLGAGLAMRILTDPHASAVLNGAETRRWHLGLGCAMLIAAVPVNLWQENLAHEDRRPLQAIARQIHKRLAESEPTVVYVLGEPGLFFHLADQSERLDILPGGDFETLPPPDPSLGPVAMYVVYGPHVMRAADDPAAGVSWAEANLTPVAEWAYRPSTLVLLNEYSPNTLETADIEPFVIRLGRIAK